MREILFRGKRVDNGEWIEGWYFQKQNPYTKDGEPITHHISNLPPFGAEIDGNTLCQYTGLIDKNGRKIWEGDIVKTKWFGRVVGHANVNDFDVFAVVYNDATFRLERKNRGFNLTNHNESWEVIGNIFDNPELLKAGDSDGGE